MSNTAAVLSGQEKFHVETADCVAFLDALPADSADLCLFSPPYEAARTYGIEFDRRGEDWTAWMVRVFQSSLRACKGLVACVCEGQTKNYRWSAVPVLLMADLHRAGVVLRKCPIYQRVGIPGSGGPDWLRNDYEFIVCATRGGRLPWSDNTACGAPPKWAPGGEISHRMKNGKRANDGKSQRQRARDEGYPMGSTTSGSDGDLVQGRTYVAPELANPGNVISCLAGGGRIGSPLAHENEAPFPEKLAEFFVRSFCPPGGIVCDPFAGSGTTAAVSIRHGRRFVGCDVRESQVELTQRRVGAETPPLFTE